MLRRTNDTNSACAKNVSIVALVGVVTVPIRIEIAALFNRWSYAFVTIIGADRFDTAMALQCTRGAS
jgi:hypothetical protein